MLCLSRCEVQLNPHNILLSVGPAGVEGLHTLSMGVSCVMACMGCVSFYWLVWDVF